MGSSSLNCRKALRNIEQMCAHHLHRKVNQMLGSKPPIPVKWMCISFPIGNRISILFFLWLIDRSFDWMRMNLLLYCLVCVCGIQIRFCIHISSHNVFRKSNEMCCNFEIQYVTETYTSNTVPCTNASIRIFLILLLCCLPANECVYWMGRGWTEKLYSHTHAHNLICNAPPIVVVILLRIFAILINWCDMSQSHIHLHCTISSLHRMQREKESEIGFNSLTMSSNKRPGRKTSMFL